MYRRQMAVNSEPMFLRRSGVSDAPVRGKPYSPTVSDLTGSTQQSRRMVLIMAEDVERSGFPTPFQAKVDRIVWNGAVLPILSVDDAKRRIAGVVIAYEIEVSGA